jgi:S1-C subfamily serine protease
MLKMSYFTRILGLIQLIVLATPAAVAVIYGEDSRRDLFELTQPELLMLSSSSVALVSASNMTSLNSQFVKMQGPRLAANEHLCPGARFENQPVFARCSGVLIASNLVLTAGHCVDDLTQCRLTQFVFNASVRSASQSEIIVPNSEIYSCAELVHTQHSYAPQALADFAIVRLDRPVWGHRTANFDQSPQLPFGKPVIAYGYPNGVPMKFIGGRVRANNPALPMFVTNLDSFDRTSGSPVFDYQSGKLEGIIVDGEDDFVPYGSCFRIKHCSDNGCRGESVTRISEVAKWFQFNSNSSSH